MKNLYIIIVALLSALIIHLYWKMNNKEYVIIESVEFKKEIIAACEKDCERAYFEGQKDAINNDIRIKLNQDSVYVWIKSPWDSNKSPQFIPTKEDTYK